MLWFVYAGVSALLFAFYGILSRVLVIKSDNPKALSAVYNFLAGFFVLGFFFIDKYPWQPVSAPYWLLLALMIFVYGIFNRTEFMAKKYMDASSYAVIGKLPAAIAFILAIFVLKEPLTIQKIFAAVLIFSGMVIVSLNQKGVHFGRGLKYALVMSFSLGIGWTIDKVAAPHFPLPIYAFLGYAAANIFVVFFPTIPLKVLWQEFKKANWKVAVLSLMASSGYLFLLKAFTLGEASKIVLINATNVFITILLALVFLKGERENLPQKLISACLVFLGVILLA